jgi:hypothetical protein
MKNSPSPVDILPGLLLELCVAKTIHRSSNTGFHPLQTSKKAQLKRINGQSKQLQQAFKHKIKH